MEKNPPFSTQSTSFAVRSAPFLPLFVIPMHKVWEILRQTWPVCLIQHHPILNIGLFKWHLRHGMLHVYSVPNSL